MHKQLLDRYSGRGQARPGPGGAACLPVPIGSITDDGYILQVPGRRGRGEGGGLGSERRGRGEGGEGRQQQQQLWCLATSAAAGVVRPGHVSQIMYD